MSLLADFTTTWVSKFPGDAVPSFSEVIDPFPERLEGFQGLSLEPITSCLIEHQRRLNGIIKELEQEELIVSLLKNLVSRLNSRSLDNHGCRMSQSEKHPVVRARPSPMPRFGSSKTSKAASAELLATSPDPTLKRSSLPVAETSAEKVDSRFIGCQFTSFGPRRSPAPSDIKPTSTVLTENNTKDNEVMEGKGEEGEEEEFVRVIEPPVYANTNSFMFESEGSPDESEVDLIEGSNLNKAVSFTDIPVAAEDSSASSIASSVGAEAWDTKKSVTGERSNKMVRVNYTEGGQYTIDRASSTSTIDSAYPPSGPGYDSDDDDIDDEPTYVRLILNHAGQTVLDSGSAEDISMHSSESEMISDDADGSLGRVDSLGPNERGDNSNEVFDNPVYATTKNLTGISPLSPSPTPSATLSDTQRVPSPSLIPLRHAPAIPSTLRTPGDTKVTVAEDDVKRSQPDVDKLKYRKVLIGKLVEDEQSYVHDLDSVIAFCKNLLANAGGTQPILPRDQVVIIFSNLEEVQTMHANFLNQLKPVYEQWSDEAAVGEIFKTLATHLPCYSKYVTLYPQALGTLRLCMQTYPKFKELAHRGFKTRSRETPLPLEEILLIPVHKVQRISLLFNDILSCTTADHTDYPDLQKAVKWMKEIMEKLSFSNQGSEFQNRYLMKNSLQVQLTAGNARKLRHVFLFSDMLICSRVKPSNRRYDVKWVIPLTELVLGERLDDQPVDWKKNAEKKKKEIEQRKKQVSTLKSDLRRELKGKGKEEDISRNHRVNKIKKRIQEQDAALFLLEPRLKFEVRNTRGECYTFLMSSDYERMEWRDTMRTHQARAMAINPNRPKVMLADAQVILEEYTDKDSRNVNSMEANVLKEAKDEDIINGQLIVSVHKILGLTESCTAYVAMEVDSFGHFLHKAKTKCITATCCDQEDFDIELESSSTLRFLCYRRTDKGDELLARSALDLSKSWLRQGFKNKQVSMNELTLVVSIKYRNVDQTILRTASKVATGVFGVKLSSVVKKDQSPFPLFVKACVEEVEKRGMTELGIYRVSGTTSDINRIKKAFDKNVRLGAEYVGEVDINAVTGALKLYFRELPEALFTDELYPSLLEAYKKDEVTRDGLMMEYFASLPPSNFNTCSYMLNHLVKVAECRADNKMPLQNISTVFGPTLLKPAKKVTDQPPPMDLFTVGATDAMNQAGILHCFLRLSSQGKLFR